MIQSSYDFYQHHSGEPTITRSLMLLGTSSDGPINFPSKVTNHAQVKSIFGEDAQGSLLRASRVIFDNINPDVSVYMMRIGAKEAKKEIVIYPTGDPTQPSVGIGFRAKSGGAQYNEVYIISQHDESGNPYLFFTYGEETTRPYYLYQYPTLGDLCKAICEDTRKGQGWVLAYTGVSDKHPSYIETDIMFDFHLDFNARLEGGETGVDICKDELYDALEEAYELLSGFYCDIVVPLDAHFDDAFFAGLHGFGQDQYFDSIYSQKRDYLFIEDEQNPKEVRRFHKQLVHFCESQMRFGFLVHGVMGFHPILDKEAYQSGETSYALSRVNVSDLATRYGLTEKVFGKNYDKGQYLSLVMSDLYDNQDRHVPGYLVYACMLVNLRAEHTTTNKPIPNREKYRLAYELESEEIVKLSELGVVTFRNSPINGLVVTNGCTAALLESEYHWYSNMRQCQVVLSRVYQAVKDLEGSTAPMLIIKTQVEELVDAVLKDLKETGIITDARYFVRIPNLNEIMIEMQLLPIHAVEFMSVSGVIPIFK